MDVLAKVSSESVVLFRVRIACRKYDQPSIYYEASKCDQYEKNPNFLKNLKYFLSERRISGNYWMIAFSLQTQSNTTVVINKPGLQGRPSSSVHGAPVSATVSQTYIVPMSVWWDVKKVTLVKDNNPLGTQKTVSQNFEDE